MATQRWAKQSTRTKQHVIYKCRCHGRRMPGGSTVAGVFSPYGSSDFLMRWAIKEHDEGRDPFAVRDQAGAFGSCIHKHWECSVTGEPFPVRDYPPAYVEIAERSTAKLHEYKQRNKLHVKHTELVVLSDEHHFGGTIDLIWEHESGELVLSDLKGSARVSVNHLIQVFGGYRIAFEEEVRRGHRQANRVGEVFSAYELLRIDRDTGDFDDHHYGQVVADDAGEAFLACRQLYEIHKSLKEVL